MTVLLIITMAAGCKPTTPENPAANTDMWMLDSDANRQPIDVFATDSTTLWSRPVDWRSTGAAKGTFWRTLDTGDAIDNSYHPLEYHVDYAYFVRQDKKTVVRVQQTGSTEVVYTNDEPIGDWRVSLGGQYIAIYSQDYRHIDVWHINPLKLVQMIDAKLDSPSVSDDAVVFDHFGNWGFMNAGDDRSVSILTATVVPNQGGNVISFVQFQVDRWGDTTVSTAPVATGVHIPSGGDYAYYFDYQQEVAWDTWPVFPNSKAEQDFLKSGTHTNLYEYSLVTETVHCIDERPTCHFSPNWLGYEGLEINVSSTAQPAYIVRKEAAFIADPQSPELTFLYSLSDEQGHEKFYLGSIGLPDMTLYMMDMALPVGMDHPLMVTHTAGRLPCALLFPRVDPWFILFDTRARGNMAIIYDISKDTIPSSTFVTELTYLNASQFLQDSKVAWKADSAAMALVARQDQTVTGSFDCGGDVHCIVAKIRKATRYWLLNATDKTAYGYIDFTPGTSVTTYPTNGAMLTLPPSNFFMNEQTTGYKVDNFFLPMNILFPTKLAKPARH
jgi:hypothetical protein